MYETNQTKREKHQNRQILLFCLLCFIRLHQVDNSIMRFFIWAKINPICWKLKLELCQDELKNFLRSTGCKWCHLKSHTNLTLDNLKLSENAFFQKQVVYLLAEVHFLEEERPSSKTWFWRRKTCWGMSEICLTTFDVIIMKGIEVLWSKESCLKLCGMSLCLHFSSRWHWSTFRCWHWLKKFTLGEQHRK